MVFSFAFFFQVRFARPESEQARQRRIQSYEFIQKKQAEEPWVHLRYHGVKVGHTYPGFLFSNQKSQKKNGLAKKNVAEAQPTELLAQTYTDTSHYTQNTWRDQCLYQLECLPRGKRHILVV